MDNNTEDTNQEKTNPYSMNLNNNQGYDPQTFGTVNSGTYDAGSYDTGNYNTGMNTTYNGTEYETYTHSVTNDGSGMTPMEEVSVRNAQKSLVIGIVLNVMNLVMMCSALSGGGFVFGGLFIVIASIGIKGALKGMNAPKHGVAVAGLVLNIIALVVAVLFILLGVVLKFSD